MRSTFLYCICLVLWLKLCPCEADNDHRIIGKQHNEANRLNIRKYSVPALKEPKDGPCAPYIPAMPNFSRPGRRISSEKCYEYIWQMKNRSEVSSRNHQCKKEKERIKNGGYYVPEIHIIGGRITLRREFSNMVQKDGNDGLIKVLYLVGGYYPKRGEFPNPMGAIGWKAVHDGWVFMCGSSLISPKFALTAAHCSSASSGDTTIADVVPKIIRLGERNIMDSSYSKARKPHDASIIRIITHPSYKSPRQYFDIALMELRNEVKFSSDVQPACLWSKDEILKYGSKAEIAGWGVVRSGLPDKSPELLSATVDIIDFEKCDKLLRPYCNRNWCGIEDHQICAGKLTGGVDSCQGDSGGPLQVKIPLPIQGQGSMHYLLGVTSFGIGCGLPDQPGVYTKISSFIDWIEPIVWT